MDRKMSRRVLGVAFVVLVLGTSGCGTRQFDVTGKVKYNGALLNTPDGQIVFVGPNGEQVVTPIGSDGTYQATGVPSGLNRVAVYYPNPKTKREKGGKLKPGEQPPPTESPFLTPAKYAAVDTSELSVTVDKETIFDIDMVGPAIR